MLNALMIVTLAYRTSVTSWIDISCEHLQVEYKIIDY